MQPSEGAQIDLGKAQVIDRVPKVIKELKFGVLYELLHLSLTEGRAIMLWLARKFSLTDSVSSFQNKR